MVIPHRRFRSYAVTPAAVFRLLVLPAAAPSILAVARGDLSSPTAPAALIRSSAFVTPYRSSSRPSRVMSSSQQTRQFGRHGPSHFEDESNDDALRPRHPGDSRATIAAADNDEAHVVNAYHEEYFDDDDDEHQHHQQQRQPDLTSRFGAIVLLEVSYVEPEYLRPWQKTRQGSCAGTGFAIPDTSILDAARDGDGKEEGADINSEGGTTIKRRGRNRRILTNMHVVQDATDIRVRKHGHSRRWRAAVVCKGPDVDLAVLEIQADEQEEIDAFWDGVPSIQWAVNDNNGDLTSESSNSNSNKSNSNGRRKGSRKPTLAEPPLLQSPVNVVGYPTGGRTICVTEGVVSRIDCRNYRLKTAGAAPGKLLVIQIDAAINPGNSGGPCFDGAGRVVGVAFQGLDGESAQNVGYIIPADVALNFLHAIEEDQGEGEGKKQKQEDNRQSLRQYAYRGVQEIPFRWAPLQNKSLRKYLKITDRSTMGVVVTKVSPLAAARHAKEFLQENDVITHIDGLVLGDDYTVSLRGDELMNADFLITGKRRNERTTFHVIRDTRRLEIAATLSPLPSNVPREHGIDCTPDWLVLGGLLFVPLTCPLLSYGTTEDLEASGYLKIYDYMDEELSKFREVEGTETCLLIDICACDTNFGYEFKHSWRVLESLNGVAVRNMAHLYNMYLDACQSISAKSSTSSDGNAPVEEEKDNNSNNDSGASEFLIFKFKNKSRIVLETADCVASEAEVLAQHGIPTAVSGGVRRRADEERAATTGKKSGDVHDEMKPPASTVDEAVSKGLLSVDAVQATYNDMAGEYLEMVKADELNDQAIGPTRAALKRLCESTSKLHESNEGGLLVDVGCGPGTNLVWLSKQLEYINISPRPQLVGIDLSQAMIDLAKKESRDADIDFRVGNMLQLDLDDTSVARMCNGCCIQHVDLDGVRTTLSEAARVLMPGGVLLLQFWIGNDSPMPGPEGAAFIGWQLDTIRLAIQDTETLVLFDESRHVYQEFDMPYAFFYIRKT